MKNFFTFSLLILGTVFFCSLTSAQNKYPCSFYQGNWDFQVKDAPIGDISGVLRFEPYGSSLASYFVNTATGDTVDVDKIHLTDTSVTLFFTAMEQNIALTLRPRDNKHIEGQALGYFFTAQKRKD
ncbi:MULTISPECIES: hypothetical protein [Chitinophagaceae]